MNIFKGLGVAIATPFDNGHIVDHIALAKIVHHLIDGGVDYLVPLGTTGENACLTEKERYTVLNTVIKENNGQLPILAGCGGNHTIGVGKTMQVMSECFNIDGFLSVSPYYNKPSQEGIYQHYKHLSEKTALPIVMYNVPPRTSSNMLPETVLRLAHECPNLVAIKEASGNLEQGIEIVKGAPDGFDVISGDDILCLGGMVHGFAGLISVAANAIPAQMSLIIKYAAAGNFAEANAIFMSCLKLLQLHFKEGNPVGIKASLAALGFCLRHVRLPLDYATDALYDEIQAAIGELQPVN